MTAIRPPPLLADFEPDVGVDFALDPESLDPQAATAIAAPVSTATKAPRVGCNCMDTSSSSLVTTRWPARGVWPRRPQRQRRGAALSAGLGRGSRRARSPRP